MFPSDWCITFSNSQWLLYFLVSHNNSQSEEVKDWFLYNKCFTRIEGSYCVSHWLRHHSRAVLQSFHHWHIVVSVTAASHIAMFSDSCITHCNVSDCCITLCVLFSNVCISLCNFRDCCITPCNVSNCYITLCVCSLQWLLHLAM